MDRGTWQATVHGVPKSQTQFRDPVTTAAATSISSFDFFHSPFHLMFLPLWALQVSSSRTSHALSSVPLFICLGFPPGPSGSPFHSCLNTHVSHLRLEPLFCFCATIHSIAYHIHCIISGCILFYCEFTEDCENAFI